MGNSTNVNDNTVIKWTGIGQHKVSEEISLTVKFTVVTFKEKLKIICFVVTCSYFSRYMYYTNKNFNFELLEKGISNFF